MVISVQNCTELIAILIPWFFYYFILVVQVGGLGDVVTSLSRALQDHGHSVEIILPKYDCMNLSNVSFQQKMVSWTWFLSKVYALCIYAYVSLYICTNTQDLWFEGHGHRHPHSYLLVCLRPIRFKKLTISKTALLPIRFANNTPTLMSALVKSAENFGLNWS